MSRPTPQVEVREEQLLAEHPRILNNYRDFFFSLNAKVPKALFLGQFLGNLRLNLLVLQSVIRERPFAH